MSTSSDAPTAPPDREPDFVSDLEAEPTLADFALRREPLDDNLALVHLFKA